MLHFVVCEETLLPRLFSKLFRNGQLQKHFSCSIWECEVLGCEYQCIATIQHFKNPWSRLHKLILDEITSMNPPTRTLYSKKAQVLSFFQRATLVGLKNIKCNFNLLSINSRTQFCLFLLETVDAFSSSTDFKPSFSAQKDLFSASRNRMLSNKIFFSSFALCSSSLHSVSFFYVSFNTNERLWW